MQIDIREAKEKDAAALLAIYAPYIENTTISFEVVVPSISSFWSRVEKVQSKAPWLVCEWDGQVIGYAYASEHRSREAYQWSTELSVYVHPNFQKRHVASVLYKTLIDLLKLQGFCNLLAGIALPNLTSVNFHKRIGFLHLGTYHKIGYKFGAWRDVSWWEMIINDTNDPSPIIPMTDIRKSTVWNTTLKKYIYEIV